MRHVLIADDHAVTRRGLRDLLVEAFGGVEVGEASDVPAVYAQLPGPPWDLVLLDILMPGGNVLDVLAKIRATSATVPILVLTAAPEVEYVLRTMQAGANGLIHKTRAADDLVAAIRRVAGGGKYLHPETAADVAAALHAPPRTEVHASLSEREHDIFCRIARGQAIKEIAADLGLSDKTIATYLSRIREKTGLTSYVEIARYALRHGLVD